MNRLSYFNNRTTIIQLKLSINTLNLILLHVKSLAHEII